MIVGILLTAVLSLNSPAAPASTTEPVTVTAEACEADTRADLQAAREIDEYTSNYSILPEPLCSTTCNSERVWCYLDPYFGTYLVCESQYLRCTFNCRNSWMN
ncbi:MAG TPA: hypothetical protein VEO54_28665 [Thermoanaerobaculia bacterium]|nr:hypothetical protein [Thermoanaerobaculia bacterium]